MLQTDRLGGQLRDTGIAELAAAVRHSPQLPRGAAGLIGNRIYDDAQAQPGIVFYLNTLDEVDTFFATQSPMDTDLIMKSYSIVYLSFSTLRGDINKT